MVDALETGRQPEVNDTKTYDNGKKVVPSYLLNPVLVDKANWKPVLVDSGYYTGEPDPVSSAATEHAARCGAPIDRMRSTPRRTVPACA